MTKFVAGFALLLAGLSERNAECSFEGLLERTNWFARMFALCWVFLPEIPFATQGCEERNVVLKSFWLLAKRVREIGVGREWTCCHEDVLASRMTLLALSLHLLKIIISHCNLVRFILLKARFLFFTAMSLFIPSTYRNFMRLFGVRDGGQCGLTNTGFKETVGIIQVGWEWDQCFDQNRRWIFAKRLWKNFLLGWHFLVASWSL